MWIDEDGRQIHDAVFSEYDERLMVRDREWKLVYYRNDNEGELYHLPSDPNELKNLYEAPDAAETRAGLMGRLFHWRYGEG